MVLQGHRVPSGSPWPRTPATRLTSSSPGHPAASHAASCHAKGSSSPASLAVHPQLSRKVTGWPCIHAVAFSARLPGGGTGFLDGFFTVFGGLWGPPFGTVESSFSDPTVLLFAHKEDPTVRLADTEWNLDEAAEALRRFLEAYEAAKGILAAKANAVLTIKSELATRGLELAQYATMLGWNLRRVCDLLRGDCSPVLIILPWLELCCREWRNYPPYPGSCPASRRNCK